MSLAVVLVLATMLISSHAADLTLFRRNHQPPIFDAYPFGDTIVEGTRVTLICNTTRTPFIAWFYRPVGQTRTTGQNVVLSVLKNNFTVEPQKLIIPSFAKLYEFDYECAYQDPVNLNIAQSGGFFTLYLAVAPSPKSLPLLVVVVVVAENDAASITCAFTGRPAPNVTLYRAGKKLAMNDGGSLTYAFANAQRSDDDNYQCVAVNVAGSSERTFKLTVEYKPRILTTTHATISVLKGMPASLHCIADALPASVYFWLHNGTAIRRTVVSKNVTLLVVMVLSLSDTGNYSCIAKNSLGEDRRDFQLLLTVPPGPPSKPYVTQIGSRQVTITWDPGFDGHGTISEYKVRYRKGNSSGWTKTRVHGPLATLTGLAPNEPYYFKIKAVNEAGISYSGPQSDEVITYPIAPPKVERVYISDVKPTLFSVYWQAPRDLSTSHGKIRSYTVRYYASSAGIAAAKYQNATGNATTANITGLSRETGYIVDVAASNRIFTGPYSDSAFAKTTGISGDGAAGTAGLSGGGAAGIAVGCVALVAIPIAVFVFCLKSKKGSKESSSLQDNSTKEMTKGSLYAEVVTMSEVAHEPVRLATSSAYQSSPRYKFE
ncbi:roundabout homolog 2-like isoform X2 [Oscarella lobularis]|uniref:roundabout homolog 2-like isoform X2 n=1 Tax=Oscarella lobularis TaxID=121494 RepID=UPI003313DAE6